MYKILSFQFFISINLIHFIFLFNLVNIVVIFFLTFYSFAFLFLIFRRCPTIWNSITSKLNRVFYIFYSFDFLNLLRCLSVCLSVSLSICLTDISFWLKKCSIIYDQTHIHTNTHTHMHTHTYTHKHTHTSTHMQTHTHKHRHTHTTDNIILKYLILSNLI